ncbi:MAG: cytochrome c oxidase assembly protein [Trueperaceae bacterium]|nr:cytochrome c oxidase assembly protein [Trueperaceae bacterium]
MPPSPLYLSWQTDPVLLGGLVTLATVYGLAAGPLRARLAPGTPFPRRSAAGYYASLILLYLLEGSPLHDLAERYSFTAHMVQHLGIAYLAAPLLLASVPAWMLRPLMLGRFTAPVARVLTQPLVAFAVFTVTFSAWHIPAVYEGALNNGTLHHTEHLIFLATSLLLWWPLLSPLPELPRPPHVVRLIYLFLLPVFQIPVFGAITFSDQVLYPTYANAAWTLGMPALSEQALGGAVMKVAGLFAFGIPFIAIFFRWYQDEVGPRAAVPAAGGDATGAA